MSNKLNKERIFYIFVTLLIGIVIFLFSNISIPAGEKVGLNLATIYHFSVFFMFTFFLSLSLSIKKLGSKKIVIILLLSLAYAISDEFHQLFVIGRFANFKDILIDFIGSSCAILTIKFTEIIKKR
ncbi:MAG: VanZ family protein [Nanobdellota archaeon]